VGGRELAMLWRAIAMGMNETSRDSTPSRDLEI